MAAGQSSARKLLFAAGVARDRILLRRHEREGPAGVRTRFLHFPLERQGRFALVAGQADAWAANPQDDAAIIAAMRSASSMSVQSTSAKGGAFADSYALRGAATRCIASTTSSFT